MADLAHHFALPNGKDVVKMITEPKVSQATLCNNTVIHTKKNVSYILYKTLNDEYFTTSQTRTLSLSRKQPTPVVSAKVCTNQTTSPCTILGRATVIAAAIKVEVAQNACNVLGTLGSGLSGALRALRV